MKEYLLLFRNKAGESDYLTTSQDMAEDMPLWQSWIGNIAGQGKLISTAPIEFNGTSIDSTTVEYAPHRETEDIIVCGYLICKAESSEEAEKWCRICPILKYTHGSVEMRPLISFPVN